MQIANADTFDGDTAESNLYSERGGRFEVRIENASGKPEEFDVRYTFGITPLQQYLVELPGGRLQALPIAWDARPEEQGGQRWFHVYGNEEIRHTDPLHWTGREQNWNYMCAECHSTGLDKNYDPGSDTYATSWAEINVSCEACHGPGSRHALDSGTALPVDLNDRAAAIWQMNPVNGIADRSEAPVVPLAQPEACGRCHSRRGIITSDYEYGRPLTDTHLPSLLEEQLYYPDGQIREEVYVYGSFLQSRMYRAGVTCSDCHDPHAAGLRTAGRASEVCSACHLPVRFAATGHHRHDPSDVECVDCHMPATTYMVVDPRRDHSFRVPRPALTISTGSPNACNGCHENESAEWAADAMADWYDRPDEGVAHYAEAIQAGRSGGMGANAALAEVIDDEANSSIVRATALTLLLAPLADDATAAIKRELSSPDPLMRIGALRALEQIAPEYRAQWAAALLRDPIRAVRIQAVMTLAPVSTTLRQADRQSFRKAEQEYVSAQLAIAERPEAHINLGNLYAQRGEPVRAEQSYQRALRMEPRAIAARVNLADLYRALARDADAERTLRDGLELDGGSAALHHALGLTLVRMDRGQPALESLRRATDLDANNARYVYVYAVALNSLGQPTHAVEVLEHARESFPADYDIAWALATMYRDADRSVDARAVAEEILRLNPNDRNGRRLIESL
jgi:tetratricopeptide (TPR) repeat protein